MRTPTRTPAELRQEISVLKRKIRKLEKTVADGSRMAAGLRESEARCRTIIDAIPDGYAEADLAGNFTFINARISEHLGYPREALIGTNIRRYQDAAGFQKTFLLYNQIFTTGAPCKSFELECFRKDGSQGSLKYRRRSPGTRKATRSAFAVFRTTSPSARKWKARCAKAKIATA
jgi:PAS domain S-box-containing protein